MGTIYGFIILGLVATLFYIIRKTLVPFLIDFYKFKFANHKKKMEIKRSQQNKINKCLLAIFDKIRPLSSFNFENIDPIRLMLSDVAREYLEDKTLFEKSYCNSIDNILFDMNRLVEIYENPYSNPDETLIVIERITNELNRINK